MFCKGRKDGITMYHENATVDALMKRGYLYLEDHDWKNAKGYFDDSLDVDPENAQAYIGMLLSELHIEREEEITKSEVSFADNFYYQKAVRFAKDSYKQKVEEYNLENIMYRAEQIAANAKTEDEYLRAAQLFESIPNYKNAPELVATIRQQAAKTKIEATYQLALSLLSGSTSEDVKKAKTIFETIPDYKDSNSKISDCLTHITELEKTEKQARRKKTIIIGVVCCAILAIIIGILVSKTNANKKMADEIYNNFLGKTFDGELEDDDGFVYAYNHNSLNEYMTYWKTTDEYSLTFNKDGTVYYKSISDMTVLAYPKNISEPKGYHNEYDGTYNSFSVEVTLSGEVFIKIGGSKYRVNVNDNNVPKSIVGYGFERITLK